MNLKGASSYHKDENEIKLTEKWLKNKSKMLQKSLLEGSRGALGGSWRLLAANTEKGGRGYVFPDPLGSRLGRLLARLGGLLGPSWPSWRPLRPVLGPSWRPKSDPDSTQPRCKDRSCLWCLLRSDFWWILVDFGNQNGTMLASKSDLKTILS